SPMRSPARAVPASRPSAPSPAPAPIAAPAAPKSGAFSMRTVSPQPNSPRIAPLAVLPVFFDLRCKRVVVIGGSEAAAWKTELLAAAGAHVDVYAEEICAELAALAPPSPLRGGEPGITLHLRPW